MRLVAWNGMVEQGLEHGRLYNMKTVSRDGLVLGDYTGLTAKQVNTRLRQMFGMYFDTRDLDPARFSIEEAG